MCFCIYVSIFHLLTILKLTVFAVCKRNLILILKACCSLTNVARSFICSTFLEFLLIFLNLMGLMFSIVYFVRVRLKYKKMFGTFSQKQVSKYFFVLNVKWITIIFLGDIC